MNKTCHANRVIPFDGAPAFGTEPSALIFDHLHKCAGTTFRYQLASRFESFYDASFLEAWVRDRQALRQSTAPRLAIAGHTALGMHDLLPDRYSVYYITILREPFSRAISEYRFLLDWYYPCPPIADYLNGMQPNYLVQHLGNGSLELATERLHTFYHVFGLTERFPDFLLLLGAATGMDFSTYENRNKTRTRNTTPDADLRASFEARNTLDFELYDRAKTLFDKRFLTLRKNNPPATPSRPTAPGPGECIPSDNAILHLIDEKRYADAAARIDATPARPDETEQLQLLCAAGALHEAAGAIPLAAERYRAATHIHSKWALSEARLLLRHGLPGASNVLLSALDHFAETPSDLPDSHLNRFRQEALCLLSDIARAENRPDVALDHAQTAFRINPQACHPRLLVADLLADSPESDQACQFAAAIISDPSSFGMTLNQAITSVSPILLRSIRTRHPEQGNTPPEFQRSKDCLRASVWQNDAGSCLHARWVILRLAALASAGEAKPVRVALYGNGRYTEWLLALLRQLPLPIRVTMILDDKAGPSTPEYRQGTVPVCRPDPRLAHDFDIIIPASDSVEHLLRQRCREVFSQAIPVYSLYQGFPFPPGPYAKADPALPRISLITVAPSTGRATSALWQAQVQDQYYPNLEQVTAVAAGHAVPTDELLPWARDVSIPDSTGYADAVRAALAEATGEWVCLANPEDTLEPGALHALAQHTADTDVVLGATRLTRNGICVDVISPSRASPEALLEWWHHNVTPAVPPSANAMFFRRTVLLPAMAALSTDLPAASLRYELLLLCVESRPGAVATTDEILASTESAVSVIEPAQSASIAQRHDTLLAPAARSHHRQLDFLLRGSSDEFVAAQRTLPCPAGGDLPPLSIITPSFNARPYLARACYSVAMQGYPQVEHLVMDGASTDGTQELFRHFPIRSISEPDRGMYEAINKGVQLATHRYIIVLSSDDFLEPGALQVIGTFLRGHPGTPFLTGGLRVIATDRRVSYNSASSDRLSNLLRWWRPNAYPYNTVAYVFTREHWGAVGGFDASLRVAADADFVMKSRRHSPFARLSDVFGTWDMRPECLTMATRAGVGLEELQALTARYVDELGVEEKARFLAEQKTTLHSLRGPHNGRRV